MSSDAVPSFRRFARLMERGLSIQMVYGEPVKEGGVTAIPVARAMFGLGAGGGDRRGGSEDAPEGDEREGFGGGVGAWLEPVGAFEVGPRGVRFVPLRPLAPLLSAVGLGLAVGWALGRRGR